MLSICEFNLPTSLRLAKADLGIDLLRRLGTLTEMKCRLFALCGEQLHLFCESSHLLRKLVRFVAFLPPEKR
ncbi:hypothetical protein EDD98_1061 [Streptomyces sp. PanSC19]|nr:hypothetical protein EDD98_1061 [Streptomyces sp. PanSC19]